MKDACSWNSSSHDPASGITLRLAAPTAVLPSSRMGSHRGTNVPDSVTFEIHIGSSDIRQRRAAFVTREGWEVWDYMRLGVANGHTSPWRAFVSGAPSLRQ